MSPSSKYNGHAATTKAIKQQRNTRLSAATSLAPSSMYSSSSLLTSSSTAGATAASEAPSAALLLTSYMNSLPLVRGEEQEEEEQSQLLPTAVEIAPKDSTNTNTKHVSRTTPSLKIMSYQNMIALLTVLVCGLATVNGLKCYMCGQYNEGVGSITPCTNYSDQYAHLYLKECSKKSEKYCVKYVSELSTVRDCATECAEKEIWETQTYCCTEDGCNGARTIEATALVIMGPLFTYACNTIWNVIKGRR